MSSPTREDQTALRMAHRARSIQECLVCRLLEESKRECAASSEK